MVAFLSSQEGLFRLSITVNMIHGGYLWTDDLMLWYAPDHPYDMLWFKFLYDLYIDIATAMCALKGLAPRPAPFLGGGGEIRLQSL